MRFAPAITLFFMAAPCLAQVALGGMAGNGAAQSNNPVSMVFEHKQTQTLADGTHINIVTHEYFYRDNLGRTRTENESETPFFGQGKPMHSVSVRDPVARTFTSWQTGRTDGGVHTFNRIDENQPGRPLPAAPSNADKAGPASARTQQISAMPRPATTTEQLGSLDVQGFPCEATRTTVVFPVDFMGNDRPITTVAQRCQSRAFGRALLENIEDPRTGTRSTTLQSVSRGVPDPSLFEPPPDYIDARSGRR